MVCVGWKRKALYMYICVYIFTLYRYETTLLTSTIVQFCSFEERRWEKSHQAYARKSFFVITFCFYLSGSFPDTSSFQTATTQTEFADIHHTHTHCTHTHRVLKRQRSVTEKYSRMVHITEYPAASAQCVTYI